ncbi:MAG: c-type cytochrome [Hyphomicrobium sp.]
MSGKTWMPATRAGMTAVVAAAFAVATPAHAQQGDATRGQQRFVECAACHSVESGVNNVGPSLAGIFGRKAGALGDYRYSAAMRKSGITWTPQTLDEYIADPQKRIPANRMPYAGLPDAAARADLIAYLEKATK